MEQAPASGLGGAHWNDDDDDDDGRNAYVNVAQSGGCIAVSVGGSRAALMMLDAIGGFNGAAATDGYKGHDRFDADGRRQVRRARHLLETRHLAKKYGCAVLPVARGVRQELHGDHRSICRTAKILAAQGGGRRLCTRRACGTR